MKTKSHLQQNLENKNNLNWKKILLFSIIGIIIIGVIILQKSFNIVNVNAIEEFINSFGPLGATVFFILYIIITLFGFSAAIFTVLAGTLFGVKWGLILVVGAATLSATIAFFIARKFSKSMLDNRKINNKTVHNIVTKIEKTAQDKGFMTIAILRLSFLPYIPLSYAAGLVKNLKSRDFILATFITNIFGSFVFIFLGASIMENLPLFLGAIVLVVAFSQLPKLIKKYMKKEVEID